MLFVILSLSIFFILLLGYYLITTTQHATQLRKQLKNSQEKMQEDFALNLLITTELVEIKEQLNQKILHDPITGLISRPIFEDRFAQTLSESKRYHLTFAVLFFDLDGFKLINDALGYDIGDELLKQVGTRLQTTIRQVDSVCRFTGDQFVFILSHLSKAETAAYAAQRILDAITEPFTIHDQELFITASIGIAVYPNDGEETIILLKNASTALHQAKSRGRQMYQFYREEMFALSRREFILDSSLRNTSIYDEFSLYYQPEINLQSKKIEVMEALLRWQHTDFGFIAPKEFLHLAEKSGKMIQIGEWVLREACQQLKKWKEIGFYPASIAVNISVRQLEHAHFTYKLSQILQETGVTPESLILEISEPMLSSKLDLIEKTLHMIKHLGVQIAIDDFGTGSLSLLHLKRFPLNYLKIDGSLIQDVTINKESEEIVRMIITLANSLRCRIVAEEVETHKQKQLLQQLGCHLMQGHLFCIPRRPEEFTDGVEKSIGENV